MAESHYLPLSARPVTEVRAEGLPALVHPEWRLLYPWLVQGMTTRGDSGGSFDLGLFSGGSAVDDVRSNWARLAEATGCERLRHARQVHESDVTEHTREGPSDGSDGRVPPMLVGPCDGHVTAEVRTLLTVATADCVPVFAIDRVRGRVGVFHAGWRGVVAGVVENGLATIVRGGDRGLEDVHVHLGPAICGDCYEVGPEVFEALHQPVPAGPTPIDLRGVITSRLERAGVRLAHVTVSTHCTLCTSSDLFSHRGGDLGRQVGYIGLRES